jgi:hypothetical protein
MMVASVTMVVAVVTVGSAVVTEIESIESFRCVI